MPTCWGITDGSAGMVAQVKALAAALGVTPEMKKIAVKKPFVWLPNIFYATPLRRFIIPHFMDSVSDPVTPPFPELVISCGRRASMVAMGLKAHIKGQKPYFINIQDPRVSAGNFDLVVAMAHDHISGNNVIKTRFALHTITPAILETARQKFAARFSSYPKPVAVLLGGSTNKYILTREAMAQVILSLQRLLERTDVSLLITPSRRTGEENIVMLRQVFANNKRVYVYDFAEENPYLGMLALADSIIVSNDSVNMMTDAYATGKPLYVLSLPGHVHTKPARFAQQLIKEKIARPLGESLETWRYPVEDEMGRLASQIKQRFARP